MRPSIVALLLLASAGTAAAQAAPNTTLASIGYNALKARIKPTGELGAQIASIDSALQLANRRGQTAEARRLMAKGTALLNNRAWADTNDYRQSLVLRTEHQFVDPTQPYAVRLEQTFAPDIAITTPLSARATIAAAALAAPGALPSARRTLDQFSDVARDLRDSPLRMQLNLKDAPDGDYLIEVEVADSARALGSARLRITVVAGLAARLAALETRAATAPADLRADIRYPGDWVRKVDHGVVPLGAFDIATELATAESITESLKRRAESPFKNRTGGFERHYLLESANEIMPYRVLVPSTYDGKSALPLIIALHGAGGTEDSFMDQYDRVLPQLAERRGYIVATPLGFRADGGYGSPILGGRLGPNSEADVMHVLALVRKDFRIDDHRIYLMGHSMGGIGAWHIGAKYPEIWAALASFSGIGVPESVQRTKGIPQFVVHGDADNTVNVRYSRAMVEAFKTLGVDYKYIEVPGGNHNDVVTPNLAAMFDFFDAKRKPTP